jgi:protein-tyrosine phosphatase
MKSVSTIIPFVLYLTGKDGHENKPMLDLLEITHVISLHISCEIHVRHNGLTYLDVILDDDEEESLDEVIPRCVEFIRDATGPVLVHCFAGMSRSASICMAYLILEQKKTFEQAFDVVKSRRPCIYPNNGFLRQLAMLARENEDHRTVPLPVAKRPDEEVKSSTGDNT